MTRQIPMLFSPAMIEALLAGRKTETRRIFKNAPGDADRWWRDSRGYWCCEDAVGVETLNHFGKQTQPGDLIWVKEAHFAWGFWKLTGEKTATGKDKIEFVRDHSKCLLFDAGSERVQSMDNGFIYGLFKRPSMFMPKADSRLTLRVTGFNIERLHDMTNADAVAEGIEKMYEPSGFRDYTSDDPLTRVAVGIPSYRTLWNSIHGPDAWDANPWVSVTKFEVIRQNVEHVE